MELADAVRVAKQYVKDAFSEEKIRELGLEELTFDEGGQIWNVTVGFSRPWDYVSSKDIYSQMAEVAAGTAGRAKNRTYKKVLVSDSNGKVLALQNRD